MEDGLLGPSAGQDLSLGVELHSEAAIDVPGDGLAQRRCAHYPWILADLGDCLPQYLQNEGWGWLARIAHAEVEKRHPARP